MDMESLYPNIPHIDGIAACQHFLEINHIPTIYTDTQLFSLGDAIYLQLMGSAMGSKMAPHYTNLFMAQLEENFLASCNTRPLTYLRFNQFHPTINLTLNHSYSYINFLDTTIKNGTIQTSLYQKPTGRPVYLMWDSFHPHRHQIKKSIVFRRNNSNTQRHTLGLQIKDRKRPIVLTYNLQLNIIRKLARDLQPMLHTDTRLKEIFPELPLLSYRQPPNLRKMMRHFQ
ncbi:hypothetical protein XELAEV_18003671mg [Xenopus laevis]|nr:hypothetical protein XELAEV_18003671mg [Xenopus laevis]